MKNPGEFMASYKTSVYDRNVEAFIGLYTTDVHIFDMWGQWELQGLETWRKVVCEWFGSLGSEPVVVDFIDTRLTQSSDMAAMTTVVRFAGHSSEGKELRWMHNRMTTVLQKAGGDWKVRHQHTSSPLDPQTLKPNLQIK